MCYCKIGKNTCIQLAGFLAILRHGALHECIVPVAQELELLASLLIQKTFVPL